MVIHRFAQHDVGVRVEPVGEFAAVVLEVGLDRVATAQQRLLAVLIATAEPGVEFFAGSVTHLADRPSDGETARGALAEFVVVALGEAGVAADRAGLYRTQGDLVGRGLRTDSDDHG